MDMSSQVKTESQFTEGELEELRLYLAQAKYRQNYCAKSADSFRNSDKWYMIILTILVALNGGAGAAGLKDIPLEARPMYIITILLSVFVAMMGSMRNVLQWAEKANNYNNTKVNYGALYRSIANQLASGCDRRIDCAKFMVQCENKMSIIEQSSPPIAGDAEDEANIPLVKRK